MACAKRTQAHKAEDTLDGAGFEAVMLTTKPHINKFNCKGFRCGFLEGVSCISATVSAEAVSLRFLLCERLEGGELCVLPALVMTSCVFNFKIKNKGEADEEMTVYSCYRAGYTTLYVTIHRLKYMTFFNKFLVLVNCSQSHSKRRKEQIALGASESHSGSFLSRAFPLWM